MRGYIFDWSLAQESTTSVPNGEGNMVFGAVDESQVYVYRTSPGASDGL